MKVLVTGGAGFIGSHFIKHFLTTRPRHQIVNIDKLTYAGSLKNLKELEGHARYAFVKADICSAKIVQEVMKGCDAVIHFAAETHVDRSIQNADHFVRTNVLGTHILLDAAVKNRIKRFLHISTDEVYGSRRKGYFKESDILNPSSPYAASKAASDLLVKAYGATHRLPFLITRSSNNFGPHQYPEKVIPLFIRNLLRGQKVPLYAKGQNVRDWIFVKDNCRAIDLVFRKGQIGEIYNIAAGNYLTNRDLTRRILKGMDKPLSSIQRVKDRPAHDFRYALDTSKIRRLGFRPAYDFDQALKETIAWYCRKEDENERAS